jgi:tetratricopeptide (TPR) repeat protein
MIAPMRFSIALLVLAICLPVAWAAEEKMPIGDNRLDGARRNAESGNFKTARTVLDQFEQANKPSVESLDLRGVLFMEEGKFAEAAAVFDAAHATNPAIFNPRLHAGDLLLRQKKFQEARVVYEALLKETNVAPLNERLRFAVMITYLGERDDTSARSALDRIAFPTQTPAYYYAQAAWSFAHGKNTEGQKWIRGATKIFPPEAEAWFARALYELGWIKEKPAPATT